MKKSNGRPKMKQNSHPAHNMPSEQHDGTQLPIGNGMPMPDANSMTGSSPLMQAMQSEMDNQ